MGLISKIETPEPIPRIYGLGTMMEDNHIVYPISSFITASIQLAVPSELERDIEGWQQYRLWLNRKTESNDHRRQDSPVFRLNKNSEELVKLKPAEARDKILEAIVRKEKAKNLWIKNRRFEAINNLHYGAINLSGEVASKSNARGRSAYRKVFITNPNININNSIGIKEVSCRCEDSIYNEMKSKSNAVFCNHAAALQLAYYLAASGIENDLVNFKHKLDRTPALPFDITPYNSSSKSYLNIEFLVARYMSKKNLFEINRKLSRLGYLLFTPVVNTMLRDGRMWFEVTRQGLKKTKESPRYIADTQGLFARIKQRLRDEGYNPIGYCIEYEGTDHESIGSRWKKENTAISLVYSSNLPLHYIRKEFTGNEVDLYGDRKITLKEKDKTGILSMHPYARIGRSFTEVDDMTRRTCVSRVILFGNSTSKNRIAVPSSIAKRYEDLRYSLQNKP